ncbi:hypothetical protein H072_9748 [Dactylellina haptotyla CBS 200.50]|uniref:Uncharacterized protein n=1 Tax=Dactylellina haptotyla (strain CBS 200.50) TaxID=1284197 RepID=S8A1T8_DACHA|nr:hypothetical protein H072_9748 [Dactylellina haptotyla CBS 200.50]
MEQYYDTLPVEEFLEGQTFAHTLKHRDAESLLPLLARVLVLRSVDTRHPSEEMILRDMKRFYKFAGSCRNSTRPFQILKEQTQMTAWNYHVLIENYLKIIANGRQQPLGVLKFIFHRELKILEFAPATQQLILTVIGDLPFRCYNWVNLWIGLIEADWASIWRLTIYIRALEDQSILGRDPKWQSADKRWACIFLRELAGISSSLLLQNGTEGQNNSVKSNVLPPVPRIPQAGETLKDVHPREVARSPTNDSPISRISSHETIKTIVAKYAQLPRLKSTADQELQERLLQYEKSEEEFNRKLKQDYKNFQLRKTLQGLESNGRLGKRVEEIGKVPAKKNVAADELEELHLRIIEQEKEVEDNEFERWARYLLEEGEDEDGDEE